LDPLIKGRHGVASQHVLKYHKWPTYAAQGHPVHPVISHRILAEPSAWRQREDIIPPLRRSCAAV